MNPRLILLRGNSGSGKTTTAQALQRELGFTTMLISQDVIRREVLRVKDFSGNPSIQLIHDMALFGHQIGYDVILEGILFAEHYGAMIQKLITAFDGNVFAYYFDVSFEETLRRHNSKPNKDEFGEAEMRKWWNEKDYLDIANEKRIDESLSSEQILEFILADVPRKF